MPRTRRTFTATLATVLTCCTLGAPAVAVDPAPAPPGGSLPASDAFRPLSTHGFHDFARDGSPRALRNDLTGELAAQVELVQSSTSNPTGNAAAELPTVVAQRTALLLVSPTAPASALHVDVRVGDELLGTLPLAHPSRLPGIDQRADARGTVSYSHRAWSAELPWQWVRPGMTLTVTDGAGRSGVLEQVDVAAPTEIVLNNIQLGMLTTAPDTNGHRFIKQPANGATDYFQTLPVSRMVMAQYEKVELTKVIVASGKVYTERSDGEGGVYSGDMRENVGKAQVSTGINLATWGITSGPMNQSQPGITNQRVIHHSAGMYANGRQTHGLSGGNGMATLYDSVGNELSHELGHSYGLGHYPGTDTSKTGDDRIRNASHHMDSGWGWIAHRKVMRSNLSTGSYREVVSINGHEFRENLAGRFNFNTDTMAGGWDASEVSDYTHMTSWTQRRAQSFLRTLVADTSYPSGYRDWDATRGGWVDAKVKDPSFDRPRPKKVGGSVFTLLGGYNPAAPEQTVLYPAFRSNYGVTFDLPQADPSSTAAARQCWLQVDFASSPTQYVQLAATDGVKQLNVNVAEDEEPTGAQVACRAGGVTTQMGDPITIATDLPPMPEAVIVGQEAGFETLRVEELTRIAPRLAALADQASPTLTAADAALVRGWSDDLSALGQPARAVAERWLRLQADAADLAAWLAEHGDALDDGDSGRMETLADFLTGRGYTDAEGEVLPAGRPVTVDNGKCLTFTEAGDGSTVVSATTTPAGCTGTAAERWWVDAAGRIHPEQRPDLCVRAQTPVVAQPCSTGDAEQRWIVEADGHVVRSTSTNSALDLYRSNHRPGLYGRSNGANQLWRGFTTSPNPLLAALDGPGLAALFAARTPTLSIRVPAPAASGWHTSATSASVVARDPLSASSVLSTEVDLGAGWTAYDAPVALPEGTTTLRARTTDARGTTVEVTHDLRVDTVAPTSTATFRARRLTVTGSDTTSGVARREYRTARSGAWTAYDAPVRFAVVPKVVQHRVRDAAGLVSPTVTMDLSTATAVTTAAAWRKGKAATVRIRVTPRATPASGRTAAPLTGRVRLRVVRHGRQVFTHAVTLNGGRTTLKVPARRLRAAGRYTVTVVYSGSALLAPSQRKVVVRVR